MCLKKDSVKKTNKERESDECSPAEAMGPEESCGAQ